MKKILIFTIAALLIIVLLVSVHAVTTASFYTEAVRWAYEQGITNGTSATTFSPDKPITRGEVVTMLWRMSGSPKPSGKTPFTDVEPVQTPKPQPPKPNPTIHPEYALAYVGRLYIGDIYSVGLYDTMDQKLVDMTDAAFIARFEGGSSMIGDHDTEGLWVIRYLEMGDTMKIVREDGTVETYVLNYDDPHVTNLGYDVVDRNGNSCLHKGYDILIATCNDSEGVDMTATFWDRVE